MERDEYIKLQPGLLIRLKDASDSLIENFSDDIDDLELLKFQILYSKHTKKFIENFNKRKKFKII